MVVAVAVVAEWMTIEHSSVAAVAVVAVVAVVFGWHTVGNEVSYDSYSYCELC